MIAAIAFAVSGLVLFAQPVRAQLAVDAYRPGTWLISAHGGGAAFTDFRRGRAVQLTGQGHAIERRVSAQTSASLGASATRWMGEHWGLRAGAGWVPTAFVVRQQGNTAPLSLATLDEQYAGLGIWLFDAGLVFRPPLTLGRVAPYGMVGAGYVMYRAHGDGELPPEVTAAFGDGSDAGLAAMFGAGAAVSLQRRRLLLNFELTNHVTRASAAPEGQTLHIGDVAFRLEPDSEHDDGVRLSNHLRLTVGLTLPLR